MSQNIYHIFLCCLSFGWLVEEVVNVVLMFTTEQIVEGLFFDKYLTFMAVFKSTICCNIDIKILRT